MGLLMREASTPADDKPAEEPAPHMYMPLLTLLLLLGGILMFARGTALYLRYALYCCRWPGRGVAEVFVLSERVFNSRLFSLKHRVDTQVLFVPRTLCQRVTNYV